MREENIIPTLEQTGKTRSLGISIRGLALSYFDNQTAQWKIIFPKAPKHEFAVIVLKSKKGKVIEEDRYYPKATRKIEIITEGKSGGSVYDQQAMKDIPNLSKLHNEQIRFINDRNRYAGFLVLNEVTLTVEPYEEPQEFEIWKIEATSPTMEHRRFIETKVLGIASDAGANYTAGARTEIRIDGEPGIPYLVHEADVNYEIIFDNDCHQNSVSEFPDSDFKFYYDIIDETNFRTKCRFDLLAIKDDGTGKGGYGSVCGKGTVENPIVPDGFF